MTQHSLENTARDGSAWRIPLGLLALTTIPLIAGSLRMLALAGGPELLPTNPRVTAAPTPVVLHVIAAGVYVVVGAFQFPARLRRSHGGRHRRAGRMLAVPAPAAEHELRW